MWLCGQWATHLKPGELEELDKAEEAREAEGHPEPELGALEAVGRDHAARRHSLEGRLLSTRARR